MAVDPAREDVDGFDAPGNLVMSVGLHLASLDVSSFTAQIEKNNGRHVWWSEGDVLCLVDAGVSLSLRLWVDCGLFTKSLCESSVWMGIKGGEDDR